MNKARLNQLSPLALCIQGQRPWLPFSVFVGVRGETEGLIYATRLILKGGHCSNGELSISNILAENAIRPFVMGRKAWLFSDTPKGAHASAIHYSLIETAKANGLEPYAYLTQVLKALPYADTVEKIEALLPWNFKIQNLAE